MAPESAWIRKRHSFLQLDTPASGYAAWQVECAFHPCLLGQMPLSVNTLHEHMQLPCLAVVHTLNATSRPICHSQFPNHLLSNYRFCVLVHLEITLFSEYHLTLCIKRKTISWKWSLALVSFKWNFDSNYLQTIMLNLNQFYFGLHKNSGTWSVLSY